MDYLPWRNEVFGQPPEQDPVWVDLSPAASTLSSRQILDWIGRALGDEEIHQRFTLPQIVIGLQLLFNPACSHYAGSYLKEQDEAQQVAAIQDLAGLYRNFFERYCHSPLEQVGYAEQAIELVCYMFWDVFVVYPGNTSPRVVEAAISLMASLLQSDNEHCQVSALHGLGHWSLYEPRARAAISTFLQANRGTANKVVLAYAEAAATGCIQ